MSERPYIPELLCGTEVADALGVLPSNLPAIKDLPDPVLHKPNGKLWLASEIREFVPVYQKRRRRSLPSALAA